MLHYTIKAFGREAPEPLLETVAVAHDHAALEAGRGLLHERAALQQVEVWRDERRIGTVERVV